MKLRKPFSLLLAGYIFILLVFCIRYYTVDTPIMEVFVVVIIISVLYLLLYFFILTVRSLQRPWKSFLLVLIITLATFYLIQTVYHEKYRLKRTEAERIQLTLANRMRELETKIVDANYTITWLKDMVISEQKENDRLRKQLNKKNNETKSIKREQKTKRDIVIRTISNKDFSKTNSEAGNADRDKKNQEIIFRVQILSSSVRLATNSPQLKDLRDMWEYKDGGLYKYTVGNHVDLKSAVEVQSEYRMKGYTDAFVVAFINGKRKPVREAKKFLTVYK